MYPVFRLAYATWSASRQPPIRIGEAHVSEHRCWPWDIDVWAELNNGRALTLYDLGRMGMFQRLGLIKAQRTLGLVPAIAGASVRYRRRVRVFERVRMVSRLLGWDDRFLYIEQSMWKADTCTSQVLVRAAVTGKSGRGLIPPSEVAVALGIAPETPPLPHWAQAWIQAEAERPWPPDAP